MEKTVVQFEVSSPEELREALAAHEDGKPHFASVRVLGPQVITRQFNFPQSSAKELAFGLKQEAADILSVAALDVEVAYQVTGVNDQGMQGVFSIILRKLLMEYLACFDGSHFVPVSLTAAVVGAVTDFFKNHPSPGENFCLVNFLKPHAVNIIVFSDAKTAFFRQLYDLDDSDFESKVKNTIRYTCSHSVSKKIDYIFFSGDLSGKDVLMKDLKELEDHGSQQPAANESVAPIDLTGLNFLEKYVLGLEERNRLVSIFSLICTVCFLGAFFLIWHFAASYYVLHDIASKTDMGRYQQALDLQGQLRQMSNAK